MEKERTGKNLVLQRPFKFVKSFFTKKNGGTLKISKEALEEHHLSENGKAS